jgi:hypothetical protein
MRDGGQLWQAIPNIPPRYVLNMHAYSAPTQPCSTWTMTQVEGLQSGPWLLCQVKVEIPKCLYLYLKQVHKAEQP